MLDTDAGAINRAGLKLAGQGGLSFHERREPNAEGGRLSKEVAALRGSLCRLGEGVCGRKREGIAALHTLREVRKPLHLTTRFLPFDSERTVTADRLALHVSPSGHLLPDLIRFKRSIVSFAAGTLAERARSQ